MWPKNITENVTFPGEVVKIHDSQIPLADQE